MKTLDEVLKSYELSCGKKDCRQCPYDDECLDHFVCECYERMDDTFHYLKEYRDYRNSDKTVTENGCVSEAENNALTWQELKELEGKPVWVEYRRSVRNRWGHRCWHIIRNIQRVQFDRIDTEWLRVDEDGVYFDKADLGKTWQAYRKERE